MNPSADPLKIWLAPVRTALLLVDMQVDFAEPQGRDGDAMADSLAAAIQNAATLAQTARAAGVPCVFVRLITRAVDEMGFLHEWQTRRGGDDLPLCREGTHGAAFVGPQPQGGEMVFSKKRYDGFVGTGLDAALKGAGIDTLVVAGLTTECCVAATVHGAFERDYHVFVVCDATAAYEPALHAAALTAMARDCATLVSTAQVQTVWNK